MDIGPYRLVTPFILAPMAGVSDKPMRELCLEFGAGMAVAEMLTSDIRLWQSRKSRQRLISSGDHEPRAVQIAGAEPLQMAEAAKACVRAGAQIIDINMGCPAKKVCNVAAGSALMKNIPLVTRILDAVVTAVDVPVTLKIRTGWCPDSRNALEIGLLAEKLGIQALTIHGRTRACRFAGEAEYRTIAEVKQSLGIPVIANGDIDSVEKAQEVLTITGADALMIGRAAQGRPWFFAELAQSLSGQSGNTGQIPDLAGKKAIILRHIKSIHCHYGDYLGCRIARKHVGWYLQHLQAGTHARSAFNRLEQPEQQLSWIEANITTLRKDAA